jgi:hypothetical protein
LRRRVRRCTNVLLENLKDRENLGEMGVDGRRILLKWILEKLSATR